MAKKRYLVMIGPILCCLITGTKLATYRNTNATPVHVLFNGWSLSPVGEPIALPGDMPTHILTTPDPRYVIVNSVGFNEHGVYAIDLVSRRVVGNVDLGKSWVGMALGTRGTILVSGGGDMPPKPTYWGVDDGLSSEARLRLSHPAYLLDWTNKRLFFVRGIDLPKVSQQRFISGVATGTDGNVFMVDCQNGSVFRLQGSDLHVVESAHVGYRPYEIAVSPDGRSVAVSNWGDESVTFLDSADLHELRQVHVGRFPNQLVFGPDGRLFVANAGSNTVSIVGTTGSIETVGVALRPDAPVGSTPDAIAVNPRGTRLFVADANNNDIAVVDISNPVQSKLVGFIPTGWYPSALAVSRDGKTLYIGVGKGLGTGPNIPYATPPPRLGRRPENLVDNPLRNTTMYNYIGGLLRGYLYVLRVPDRGHLYSLTAAVRKDVPSPEADTQEQAVQQTVFPKIKHVLYIIRENRTYDEVFGDMPQGNGDPRLVLFGAQITPNAHRLAQEYVLFDNLYTNGEVSQDGHPWCDQAYATDFTEKAWIYSYSGRGKLNQDGRLSRSPAGAIWTLAVNHGLRYENYGEGGYPTSKAWARLKLGWFEDRDTQRAAAFIADLRAAQKSGRWPALMVMSLPEDHTQGLLPGAYSPSADVATNDFALGRIVEAISHSRFWRENAEWLLGQNLLHCDLCY
jgi:DNA-binding beta-propeller fold protein YncE